MQGEQYIRGLSDNELAKLVSLYRDMYSKEELQIADDEMSRRKRATVVKANTPAAAPRPSENHAAQAAAKPETAVVEKPIPPAATRASTEKIVPRSRRTFARGKAVMLNRSVVDEDYCMPPPEEMTNPEPNELGGVFPYHKPQSQQNLNRRKTAKLERSMVEEDYRMPPSEESADPETPHGPGGAFFNCTNCGNLYRRYEEYCPNCGQKPR